jgi:hypothetical protein
LLGYSQLSLLLKARPSFPWIRDAYKPTAIRTLARRPHSVHLCEHKMGKNTGLQKLQLSKGSLEGCSALLKQTFVGISSREIMQQAGQGIPIREAQPKSMSVQECARGRQRTFAGLRSRCTKPSLCSCCMRSATWPRICRMVGKSGLWRRTNSSRASPRSIIMHGGYGRPD